MPCNKQGKELSKKREVFLWLVVKNHTQSLVEAAATHLNIQKSPIQSIKKSSWVKGQGRIATKEYNYKTVQKTSYEEIHHCFEMITTSQIICPKEAVN